MGISQTKITDQQPDKNGNQKWILPHGIVLQVEDFYQEEREYEGRKINYIILSNKIDLKAIVKVDKETAR